MKKVIVTLKVGPSQDVDVPDQYRVGRGRRATNRAVQRSCFGCLRLYPGLPKAVSEDELSWIEAKLPVLFEKLAVRPYVESRRADKVGCSEADVEAAAEASGLGHLRYGDKVRTLKQRSTLPVQKTPPKQTSKKRTSK